MSSSKIGIPQLGNRADKIQKGSYVRAYMACQRCRTTKAKCEISGDSAACVRCVRERRECVFASERSAKRHKKNSESVEEVTSLESNSAHNQPKITDSERTVSFHGRQQTPRTRTTHGLLIDTVVSSSKDALGILFNAADQNDSDEFESNADNLSACTFDTPASAVTSNLPPKKILPLKLSKPTRDIIQLWNQHRFVRQGWFTAVEAVTYIDLFFKNLSSLSPVSSYFYANHSNHRSLILEEPFLCCTMLMISSRYHVLPGLGGISRADYIHMRLWKHCEHLIQTIIFGQEKYSCANSRTLGSIKALLLMTEWHPRSLHFPPEGDGWDSSFTVTLDDPYGNVNRTSHNAHSLRWREEVFEPAKRSDRMSWMLLGLATTLAHELGVFTESDPEDGNMTLHPHNRVRTRRLLFLHVNQLSLRLGCTTFLPQSISLSLDPPYTELSDTATKERDMIISKWIDITKLRKTTTEMFFSSKFSTRQIMSSGRYVALLEHFHPLLAQWKRDFDAMTLSTLPPVSKQMLLIDYGYVRMYINSIALQAVVQRAEGRSSTSVPEFDFLRNEYKQDYKYIQEVIDASRSVLGIAVELADVDLLRYAPVRVFIRVASAAVFLLKAISLGTNRATLQTSLDILQKSIHALRFHTCDDMHLSSRYGLLLDRHVRRFKRNFRTSNGLTIPPTPEPAVQDNNSSPNHEHLPPIPGSNQLGMASEPFNLPFDLTIDMDNWLAQPFDPSFAPFGMDLNQTSSVLDESSLEFLWNIPDTMIGVS